MLKVSGRRLGLSVAMLLCASSVTSAARAEDFLSALFGAFSGRSPAPPPVALPFAREGAPSSEAAPRSETQPARVGHGGGEAWCVRTCDGRYFPITGPDNQSRVAACNSFCPAAATSLVYGSNIDGAATEAGKPYSELPNAFRYRNEIVAGCTCNGKDQFGLAPVSIENDATLRKGDIVAGANGLLVANPAADKRAALNFSPLPESVRARFKHVPVVASGQ
jgi:Protein of unknown function (DUF2865)